MKRLFLLGSISALVFVAATAERTGSGDLSPPPGAVSQVPEVVAPSLPAVLDVAYLSVEKAPEQVPAARASSQLFAHPAGGGLTGSRHRWRSSPENTLARKNDYRNSALIRHANATRSRGFL